MILTDLIITYQEKLGNYNIVTMVSVWDGL